MRVGLLADCARRDDRVGRQIAAKVAFFRDRGADVRLIMANDTESNLRLRANSQRFSRQLPDRLLPWLERCDLIVLELAKPSPVIDLIPKLAGGKPKFIVTDYDDSDLRDLAWFADVTLVRHSHDRDEFLAETGYPADRTELLHDPVDLSWFVSGTAEKPLRTALGIEPHSRLLLMVGQLAATRRGPFVIDALAQLPASVHVVFVGESGGPFEPERQRCRERAARHQIADRIHFLGIVDDRELRDAYRDADLFISSAAGLSMIEAMACGLPVVETRAGAGDATELATQVRRVLNSPEDAAAMRKAGLERAAESSLDSWRDRFGQLIDRLLESQIGSRLDPRHELSGPNRCLRLIPNAPAEDAA